jgi:oxygen-dependent protoporphyrinogen oxidase
VEESLSAIARQELKQTLAVTADPIFEKIFIWEDAMPQYNLGHAERLGRIDSALFELSGLAVAGNGYQGIGIPDCIHSGGLAADRILSSESEHAPRDNTFG